MQSLCHLCRKSQKVAQSQQEVSILTSYVLILSDVDFLWQTIFFNRYRNFLSTRRCRYRSQHRKMAVLGHSRNRRTFVPGLANSDSIGYTPIGRSLMKTVPRKFNLCFFHKFNQQHQKRKISYSNEILPEFQKLGSSKVAKTLSTA